MNEEEMELEAESIADEAVAGYEKVLAPHVIAEMRRIIIFDLLASDVGRARLRRAIPDRLVERSGELGASDEDEKKATGSGS